MIIEPPVLQSPRRGRGQTPPGRGLPRCHHSGYRGRLGLFELFIPDRRVKEMILQQRAAGDIGA